MPADAPECVQTLDGHYYAYFEQPRFCWDEPIYCKVRTAKSEGDDLYNPYGGDECTIVGYTANGRKIWRWEKPQANEAEPVEIIFSNHDLSTAIMHFANGGYYKINGLLYKAGQTDPSGVATLRATDVVDSYYYDLQGRRFAGKPARGGVYIQRGRKLVVR